MIKKIAQPIKYICKTSGSVFVFT